MAKITVEGGPSDSSQPVEETVPVVEAEVPATPVVKKTRKPVE